MPVITFNKKYLYGLIGGGMDDDKFRDQVSKLGFDIESMDHDNVAVELTANRLDLLDAVGLARTLKNFMHKSKKFIYKIDDTTPAFTVSVDPSVKKIRPYISGLVAEGLRLDDQAIANLMNFCEKFCDTYGRGRRKIAIGMHNLGRVKPPIIFRSGSDESFVPLGGKEKISYSKVLEETEKGRQYSKIIKSGKVCYYPELIDSEGTMAFIPILNSDRTKLTPSTTSIFVDITGTSQYAVNKTADLIAATFMDMDATVRRVRISYDGEQVDTPELAEKYLVIPLARIEREIGIVIGFNNVISLANKMGYEAALVGNNIRFRIPEYRLDIIDEQDVIEDIAIGYGYEYIRPLALPYTQGGEIEHQTKFNRRAAEIAVGLGFSEFANSYLTNEEMNFDRPNLERDSSAVMLKNPKTEATTIMRTWVLPSLLHNLGMSTHDKMPQNGFELDMAFKVKGGKVSESYHIAALSVDPKTNFNDIKASVEGFLTALGVDYSISKYDHKSFIDGRCGEVKVNDKNAGFFGEIHPKVLKNFGIEEPGTAFEIVLDKLHKDE